LQNKLAQKLTTSPWLALSRNRKKSLALTDQQPLKAGNQGPFDESICLQAVFKLHISIDLKAFYIEPESWYVSLKPISPPIVQFWNTP
jgi:hypothetical protein